MKVRPFTDDHAGPPDEAYFARLAAEAPGYLDPPEPREIAGPSSALPVVPRLVRQPPGPLEATYLDDMDAGPVPAQILGPLIAGEGVTVLFGDGGTGKSALGLAACIAKATGEEVIYGLPVRGGQAPALFLDWEHHTRATVRRKAAIYPGRCPVLYYAPSRPFADEYDRIAALVAAEGIGLVVADSIIPALPGRTSPKDAEAAAAFCNPANALGVPVLALGHVTHEQSADPTMPFGSRFFHNLARMTWSAKREPEEGHVVRLVNRKANDEAIALPFLVELTWGERVELRRVDLVPEMQTVADKIEAALATGPLTVRQLVEVLGIGESSMRTHLARHADRFGVVSRHGKADHYGLTRDGIGL
jgi:hypothetical protein